MDEQLKRHVEDVQKALNRELQTGTSVRRLLSILHTIGNTAGYESVIRPSNYQVAVFIEPQVTELRRSKRKYPYNRNRGIIKTEPPILPTRKKRNNEKR